MARKPGHECGCAICRGGNDGSEVKARFDELAKPGKKVSLKAIAKEFGVSRPTITRALDITSADGENQVAPHRKEPTVGTTSTFRYSSLTIGKP